MGSDSMIRMRARSRSVVAVPAPKTPLRNPDEPIETSSLRANGSVEGLQLIGQEPGGSKNDSKSGTPARIDASW